MENLSEKVKIFLNKKRELIGVKIRKIKRKRKWLKYCIFVGCIICFDIYYYSSLTGFVGVPAIVLISLSTSSGILTALSAKFNLNDRKVEIEWLIDKLNKLHQKIDYVVSCNGNLTREEYEQILNEFV